MKKPDASPKPRPLVNVDPRAIPPADITEVAAIKAVQAGTATEDQQKRFFKFLVTHVCGYTQEHFYPGQEDATAFSLGKRRVATYLISYLDAPIERFRSTQETGK